MKKWVSIIDVFFNWIDKMPLWVFGIVLEGIVFLPYVVMGEASVFPWHDQMDENILHYVITARHLGERLNTFPEMMTGVQASALQPFACLFLPLYRLFTPFVAFTLQYALVFAIAFYGMYFAARSFTDSNVIALIVAGCFSMLPFYPVYGAAVAGIPMCVLGIRLLEQKKKPVLGYACTLLFGLTAHAVFTGYVMALFWGLLLLKGWIKRKNNNWYSWIGFFLFCLETCLVNYQLFLELFFQTEDFISHRTEFVSAALPFWESVSNALFQNMQPVDSCQKYLIFPILLMLFGGILFKDRNDSKYGEALCYAVSGGILLVVIAFLYGFFKSQWYVAFKNASTGILHYFQIDRFFWAYPALWWLELGFCIRLWWKRSGFCAQKLITVCILGGLLLPSLIWVRDQSYFYMSVNQWNNGSEITGYISWESYYAADLFSQIEEGIGKRKEEVRVVHLGMNPTPALMYGFYTMDGYANSYPLAYKHAFRRVMERELEKVPEMAVYYDTWGSRCYLFNSQTGTSFMNGKENEITYEGLEYDWVELKNMGCDYLFSCGEILDWEECGLEFLGNFTSSKSFWKVWVYKL